MTSGDLFTVYPVASNALNNPPAAPGALIKKFVEVVTAPTAFVLVNVENLRPDLPLAEWVAIALAVIRRDPRVQEVTLVVSAHLRGADSRLHQQRRTRLPRRKVTLRNLRQRVPRKRYAAERRIDVGARRPRTRHRFRRDEAARRQGHSLIPNRRRTCLFRLLLLRLGRRYRGAQHFVAHLQIAYRGIH